MVCWNCGQGLDDIPLPISRHATCGTCFNELHCCRLCRHFDPVRNIQCFEDRADPPLRKENANFCDFFSPSTSAHHANTTTKSDAARSELDALFGNPPKGAIDIEEQAPAVETDNQPLSKEEEARNKLDDLFS